MMLFDRTRILESIEKPVATGFTVTAEGQPVVMDVSGGVRPAAAAATDKFFGVAWSQQLTITALPFMETVVAPVGGGTVSLSRSNLYTATARIAPALTITYTTSTTPVSGQVLINITNGTATFHGDDAGTYTLGYRYAPTVVEVQTVQGDIPAGGSAQFITGSVGVVRHGEVYTTEYNTTIDWATAVTSGWVVAVKNGLFTAYANAAGATADNAVLVADGVIVNVPAVGFGTSGFGSNAFLGVAF